MTNTTPGSETRVNTTTTANQLDPTIIALAEGGWIVAWQSLNQDGSSWGIYLQRYDASGSPVGGEQLINTYTTGGQTAPSVAALRNGGFVVTWESIGRTVNWNRDIIQQRFDLEGNRVGAEERVNATEATAQSIPSVTGLTDGGWVVTWRADDQGGDPSGGIYQQAFNADGTRRGGETRVNVVTVEVQDRPIVSALRDGGWVVTWESHYTGINTILQQRFSASGAPVSSADIIVEGTAALYKTRPCVTVLADGGWIVTWTDYGATPRIVQQRYDANGNALFTTPQRVSVGSSGTQEPGVVAALDDGGWVVVWEISQGAGSDGSETGIFYQRFDRNGNRLFTTDQLVTVTTLGSQKNPAVTALPGGGFVVSWESPDGTNSSGIFQRAFFGDTNRSPTDITLSRTSMNEGSTGILATMSAVDADASDTHTFTLHEDTSGKFEIAGNQIRLKSGQVLDYESAGSHIIKIKATDNKGASFVKTVTLTINDINEAPTNVTLSNTQFDETATGRLATIAGLDQDTGDSLTYLLSSDPSGKFEIVGNELRLKSDQSLDYGTASFHVIRITAVDRGGLSFTKSFALDVNLVPGRNHAPTNVRLDGDVSAAIGENPANGTVVGALSAGDFDGDSVAFSFAAGGDAGGRFIIDNATRQIKIANGALIDYEALPSGARYYTVNVIATDSRGMASAPQTLKIFVNDVNEAPVLTVTGTDPSGSSVVNEGAGAGAVVANLSATDPDGDSFTYSLLDSASGRFAIGGDALTGYKVVVADGGLIDYETASTHGIIVAVTDARGLTQFRTVTVNVRDINEAPVAIGLSNMAVAENAATGTLVGTLSPTDPDAGESITFTLVDDAGGRFVLGSDGKSIVVADGTKLDHESATQHTIKVIATDRGGLSLERVFTISVNDVAEPIPNRAPTTVDLTGRQAAENAASGTFVGNLLTTDEDIGDTFTYTLLDDAGGRFRLSADGRSILVADGTKLDFETATQHAITVKATDHGGLSVTKTITIDLIDLNETVPNTAPTDVNLSNRSVAENAAGGTFIGNLLGTDLDPGDSLTYTLLDNADGRFALSADGKSLLVADGTKLDFETATQHTITVKATDRGGLSVTRTITVGVVDLDESVPNNAPTNIELTSRSVLENASSGTFVGNLIATDQDAGETFTYTLLDNADGRFALSADGRSIIVADGTKLDFETATQHTISVTATDRGGLSVTKTITITLTDVDERIPNTAPTDVNLTARSVAENAASGTFVGNLVATDQDAGETFTYTLLDNAEGRFVLSDDGRSIIVANDAALDFETATQHTITVKATDRGGLSVTKTITIDLIDVDETVPNHAPTDVVLLSRTVAENAGAGTFVGNLAATDQDPSETFTFTLTDDADGRFRLSSDGAAILVADGSKLDFETATQHTISVKATDRGGLHVTKTITIDLIDVDERVPNRAPTHVDLSSKAVAENAASGTFVGNLVATDQDAGETFTYTLLDDADGRFRLSGDGKSILVADGTKLDFEMATQHTISVTATDRGGLSVTKAITIALTDVDERIPNNAPTDVSLSNRSVAENAAVDTFVGNLVATDQDPGDSFTYTLLDDAGGRFRLSADGRSILVADGSKLDFETATQHTISVQATDRGGLSVTRAVTIDLIDVDERIPNNAPADVGLSSRSVAENAAADTFVGQLVTVDPDTGDTFTYTLLDTAGGRFKLSADGRSILVADGSKLDFETATQHTISVQATDRGGLSVTKTITIDLIDLNETVPNTAPTDVDLSNKSVAENAAAGTFIGNLLGTDQDPGDSLTYTLLDNADGRFALSADGRSLLVADGAKLDFETATQHTITVKATDRGGLSVTRTITIGVVDLDERVPNNAPTHVDLSNKSLSENAAAGTFVGNLITTDQDPGETFTYTLLDNADGRFRLSGDGKAILVADGTKLDFETATQHNVSVKATDRGGLSVTRTITINLTDVDEAVPNNAPTNIELTSRSVLENASSGTFVGNLFATDQDPGETFTYTLLDNADGRFALSADGRSIIVADGTKLDFETATQHTINVKATDRGGLSVTKTITIGLIDVDERIPNNAPTDVGLSSRSVAENATNGTFIGSLITTDRDVGDMFAYTLLDDAGGRFRLSADGRSILVADGSQLDFETATQHTISVKATDRGGLSVTKTITIDLIDLNETVPNTAPTDVNLSNRSVAENAAAGTFIGNLLGTDQDPGDSLTYTLLDNAGGRFGLSADGKAILVADGTKLDFETATQHTITVKATDRGGLSVTRTITIGVVDLDERVPNNAPTHVDLSNRTIAENAAAGTFVGNLITADQDAGDSFTYTLLDDAGGRFRLSVDGKSILVNDGARLDFETATQHAITVKATDRGGLSVTKTISIDLTDIDETIPNTAPTDIALSNRMVADNAIAGLFVGLLQTTDTDRDETFTYTLLDDAGGRFRLSADGTAILVADPSRLDRIAASQHTIKVKVVDRGGLSLEKEIVIDVVAGANRDPLDISFNNVVTPLELAQAGTKVGDLSAVDQDRHQVFTFTLENDAGGRFRIGADGRSIEVADGLLLDFEQARQHVITVRVNDGHGGTLTKDLTVSIGDVAVEVINGSDADNKFMSGSARDSINGGGGDDTLHGGNGNDTLTGGSGEDAFVFDTALGTSRTDRQVNFDTITDYNAQDDAIWLSSTIFTRLEAEEQLSAANFVVGSRARDRNDYIIYNRKTGVLSYDADGSGRGKAIEIAVFQNKPILTAAEFFVV